MGGLFVCSVILKRGFVLLIKILLIKGKPAFAGSNDQRLLTNDY